MIKHLRILCLFAVIWSLAALPVWAETINFYASPTSINEGETTTLHWQVTGVWAVHLSGEGMPEIGVPGECPVGSECTQAVTPVDSNGDGQVTYTLRVTQIGGTDTTRTVNITVTASGGGGGGWQLPPLPHIPTAAEVLNEMLSAIFEPVLDTLAGWLGGLTGYVTTFAENNFTVDGPGLFGQITNDLFSATIAIVGPFWTIAFMVTMIQNVLERPLPGIMGRIFNVETIIGRILILFLVVPNIRTLFGGLASVVDSLAWGLIASGTGGAWGWVTTLITPLASLLTGGVGLGMGIILVILIMALFVFFLLVVTVNNLTWVLVVVAFPFASIAWLTPFTESLWSKYWGFVFKVSVLPMLVALMLRVTLALLVFTNAHVFMGTLMMIFVAGIGSSLILKFLLSAAPIAAGAALAASGNPMGIPMMIQGVSGLFGGKGGSMGRQASQAVNLSRKIDGGGE